MHKTCGRPVARVSFSSAALLPVRSAAAEGKQAVRPGELEYPLNAPTPGPDYQSDRSVYARGVHDEHRAQSAGVDEIERLEIEHDASNGP